MALFSGSDERAELFSSVLSDSEYNEISYDTFIKAVTDIGRFGNESIREHIYDLKT